ncbi:hypothetical protein VTH06DRAFT_7766 [Thermothelomyces fergusii]
MTKQWDKYREVIIAEYRDQNKPLHEVRRFMMEKHGFRASTRAYRSRFDRWGIHKYSRRRREGSASPSRRNSISGGDTQRSPRPSPDPDDGDSRPITPFLPASSELLSAEMYGTIPMTGVRRPHVPYTPIMPLPSPAVAHSQGCPPYHYGYELTALNSQHVGYYSPDAFLVYGIHDPRVPGHSGAGEEPRLHERLFERVRVPAGNAYRPKLVPESFS